MTDILPTSKELCACLDNECSSDCLAPGFTCRKQAPTSNERLQSIHTICGLIRSQRYAGVDEREVDCKQCLDHEDTPYGPGTRGCFLLALECYQAAHGRRSFSGEPFVPVAGSANETSGKCCSEGAARMHCPKCLRVFLPSGNTAIEQECVRLRTEVERLRPAAESWESYVAAQERKGEPVEPAGLRFPRFEGREINKLEDDWEIDPELLAKVAAAARKLGAQYSLDMEQVEQVMLAIEQTSAKETMALPTPESIASDLASARAGTKCPLCARAYVHQHTPEEIIIYRNGVKHGRSLAGHEPDEPRCPDCGLLLDPPGHDINCPRRAENGKGEQT